MGNEQKVIELQRDTDLSIHKLLILNNVEIVTFNTVCTSTPVRRPMWPRMSEAVMSGKLAICRLRLSHKPPVYGTPFNAL